MGKTALSRVGRARCVGVNMGWRKRVLRTPPGKPPYKPSRWQRARRFVRDVGKAFLKILGGE